MGTQKAGRDCAIARALGTMGIRGAWVGFERNFMTGREEAIARIGPAIYSLGEEGREFIKRFDSDKRLVAPTTLTLSPYFSHQLSLRQMAYAKPMMPPFVMSEGTIEDTPVTATSVMIDHSQGYPKYQYGVDYGTMPKFSPLYTS